MHLPEANITINVGKDPKDYIDIIGKSITYKRSNIRLSQKGKEIKAVIEAKDSRALLASMQSLMKQFRIINNVDNMLEKMTKKSPAKV
jgi:tRNA threonylcarbamoyladenosine modification (KEOPS) complex  Pcc1 subunit